MTFRVDPNDGYAIVEFIAAPGCAIPMHFHHGECISLLIAK